MGHREGDKTWFWLGLAVVCFLLALGPRLRFRRVAYEIPMPYQLIGWLPPIKLLGPPRRFNGLLGLPLAILVGYGALNLKVWLASQPWGKVLARPFVFAALLGALLLLDYLAVPMATVPAHVPDFYTALAEEQGDFAIMGLPGERKHAEYYMFYQTVHGHPLLSGHVSRLPPQALEFMAAVPLLEGIYESGRINTSHPNVSHQLSPLAQAGFRYIVIHKNLIAPEQLTEWRSYLATSPRYEDDEVSAYAVAPVAGRDFVLHHELGGGVGLIDARLSTDNVHPQATLELQLVWGTTDPPAAKYRAEVDLSNAQGFVEQTEHFEISPSWPIEDWPANAIVHDTLPLQIERELSGGEHTVTLSLKREGDDQPVGQSVELGEVDMLAPERSFIVPAMEHQAGVDFGDALRLLGYDLRQSGEQLAVTLHWQALRRMETDYKFFFHLHDEASGELVAQVDVMPRDWTYPTSWWEADEVVSDEVIIPMGDASPEWYRLWLGAYDPGAGQRLPIGTTPARFTARDERLMLPQIIEWRMENGEW